MTEIILALFAIGVGAVFCFHGYRAMRVIFPLWGMVTGYWLGAQAVHLITGDSFLGTTLGIIVGIVFAILGALLAYLYFSAAILLFMGVVGFWLGSGIIELFGIRPGILSATVGIVLGVFFVLLGLVIRAPRLYLLIITAFAGAGLLVAGTLLLINVVDLQDFENGALAVVGDQRLFWRLAALGLALAGMAAQIVAADASDQQWAAEWKKAEVAK